MANEIDGEYARNSEIDDILVKQFNALYKDKKYSEAQKIVNQISSYKKASLQRKLNRKL